MWHFFNNKKAKWTNTTKKGYDLSATRLNKELKNVKFLNTDEDDDQNGIYFNVQEFITQ